MEWAFRDAKIELDSLYPIGGLEMDLMRYGV
jgi:hypothetical protein